MSRYGKKLMRPGQVAVLTLTEQQTASLLSLSIEAQAAYMWIKISADNYGSIGSDDNKQELTTVEFILRGVMHLSEPTPLQRKQAMKINHELFQAGLLEYPCSHAEVEFPSAPIPIKYYYEKAVKLGL